MDLVVMTQKKQEMILIIETVQELKALFYLIIILDLHKLKMIGVYCKILKNINRNLRLTICLIIISVLAHILLNTVRLQRNIK